MHNEGLTFQPIVLDEKSFDEIEDEEEAVSNLSTDSTEEPYGLTLVDSRKSFFDDESVMTTHNNTDSQESECNKQISAFSKRLFHSMSPNSKQKFIHHRMRGEELSLYPAPSRLNNGDATPPHKISSSIPANSPSVSPEDKRVQRRSFFDDNESDDDERYDVTDQNDIDAQQSDDISRMSF